MKYFEQNFYLRSLDLIVARFEHVFLLQKTK